ncbi:MAG: hypothetical protein IKK88_04305 [Oscillospiraceae bacterium]|nr:hypothetical protein [Oscillospiraceae bacterium]
MIILVFETRLPFCASIFTTAQPVLSELNAMSIILSLQPLTDISSPPAS